MGQIIDTAITYRILRLLTTPWKKQKAYKLAIIDEHGNPLLRVDEMTSEQRDVYTILVRLVFRLKRLIEKIPLGNKQFLSYAAALALLKECTELQSEPVNLEEMFFDVRGLSDLPISVVETYLNSPPTMKSFSEFSEDAGAVGAVAANSTANVVATGDDKDTVIVKKKSNIQRRNPQNV
jgi:hypothetical protein